MAGHRDFKQSRGFSTFGSPSIKAPKEGMEVTKFNMGVYDMERMDKILIDVHNSLRKAQLEPGSKTIQESIVDLGHAWNIFKWAYQSQSRKMGQEILDDIENKWELYQNNTPEAQYNLMPAETGRWFISRMRNMLDHLYRAKQEVGLGIPKNRWVGAEAKIRSSVRS